MQVPVEVTPIDLCRSDTYEKDYYLLGGDTSRQISRYDTLEPEAWNV